MAGITATLGFMAGVGALAAGGAVFFDQFGDAADQFGDAADQAGNAGLKLATGAAIGAGAWLMLKRGR